MNVTNRLLKELRIFYFFVRHKKKRKNNQHLKHEEYLGQRFETDSYSDTDSAKHDFDLRNQTFNRF